MAEVTQLPRTVAPHDVGYLNAGISASSTSITIGPIYKWVNGVLTQQGFDSTSGMVEITIGNRFELVSFGTASVNATTKITTLTDIRRGLSVTSTSSSYGAGTGLAWPKGARVAVVVSAHYQQDAVMLGASNTFTATNTFNALITATAGINVSAGYLGLPVYANTTARDAAIPSPSNGQKVYVTGVGEQVYSGGAWVTTNAASTGFASDHAAGAVDIGSATEIGAGTATDATSGAINVIPVSQTTKTSNGASDENKIPVLQADGALHINHIATGTPDGTKFVRDDGVLATPSFTSTDYNKVLYVSTSTSAEVGASSTAINNLATNYSIQPSEWGVGSVHRLSCGGNQKWAAGTLVLHLRLGSTDIASGGIIPSGTGEAWSLTADIVCRTTGSSGTVIARVFGTVGFGANAKIIGNTIPQVITINTTTAQTLQVAWEFQTSNANNAMDMRTFIVERLSTTAS